MPFCNAMGVTTRVVHVMPAVINDLLGRVWRSSGGRVYGFHLYLALYLLRVFAHPSQSCSDLSLYSERRALVKAE